MAQRFITLPNRRRVSLAAYVFAWRRLKKEAPDAIVSGFFYEPAPVSETLREFARGLEDRINARGRLVLRESRAHPSTFAALRDGRVTLERERVASLNRHMRPRVAHRARLTVEA